MNSRLQPDTRHGAGVNMCAFTPGMPEGRGSGFLATCHIDVLRQEACPEMTSHGLQQVHSHLQWVGLTMAALQGRVLMWDVEGCEGWVDGKIQGYCRHFEGFRGKVTSLDFCRSVDGEQ